MIPIARYAHPTEFASDDGEEMYVLAECAPTRGRARARIAQEIGCDFTEVRSIRMAWMRKLTDGAYALCGRYDPGAILYWHGKIW